MLPVENTYSGLVEIRRLLMLLSLTGDETKELEVKLLDNGQIQFENEKALGMIADIPMGEWITNTIRGILRDKSDKAELKIAEASLYEKFILDYE
jgi:hypothetical protein